MFNLFSFLKNMTLSKKEVKRKSVFVMTADLLFFRYFICVRYILEFIEFVFAVHYYKLVAKQAIKKKPY